MSATSRRTATAPERRPLTENVIREASPRVAGMGDLYRTRAQRVIRSAQYRAYHHGPRARQRAARLVLMARAADMATTKRGES